MGIKLFVDDYRMCPKGWHPAKTVTDAIRILATVAVDEVSLDHDIIARCNRHTWDNETFFTVAYYLALMPLETRPKIRIHTGNIPQGRKMAELLGLEYDNYIYKEEDYNVNDSGENSINSQEGCDL